MSDELSEFANGTSIDEILRRRAEKEKAKEVMKEEMQQHADILNRLAATEDGMYLLKMLKKNCGVNSFDKNANAAKLLEDNGRRSVYLGLIHPYLDPSVRSQLES